MPPPVEQSSLPLTTVADVHALTGTYSLRWEVNKDQQPSYTFDTVGGGDISPHDGVLYVPMRVNGDNGDTTLTRSCSVEDHEGLTSVC